MELYTYYRSTSSYRVRIALALKELDYRSLPVNLLEGEHRGDAFCEINPQRRVPVLRDAEGRLLSQSPAILEYLEERYPQPSLLPSDAYRRAQVRSVAAVIGCDVHPLHNVSVLNVLRKRYQLEEPSVQAWIGDWISAGLQTVEATIEARGFCFGDVSLADVYLMPQLYAAERFGVALDDYPRIRRVQALAASHTAFQAAHPDRQSDAPAKC